MPMIEIHNQLDSFLFFGAQILFFNDMRVRIYHVYIYFKLKNI